MRLEAQDIEHCKEMLTQEVETILCPHEEFVVLHSRMLNSHHSQIGVSQRPGVVQGRIYEAEENVKFISVKSVKDICI